MSTSTPAWVPVAAPAPYSPSVQTAPARRREAPAPRRSTRREPGGFAFLGVPGPADGGAKASAASTQADTASSAATSAQLGASGSAATSSGHASEHHSQRGGGPFSP
jgi:hypothetical protein